MMRSASEDCSVAQRAASSAWLGWVAIAGVAVATMVVVIGGLAGPVGAVNRLAGSDRLQTAIAIARDAYPQQGSAEAVVLARADVFADALAGTPLAVGRDAPVLITHSGSLADPVAGEIQRVLGDDTAKTVFLLGGSAALSEGVRADVEALGYRVRRLAGESRFDTATAIADELGAVDAYLITTGTTFPDALSAGPAAAAANGAVLLSAGQARVEATDDYLDAHPGAERIAIGGPAARAYGQADDVVGATREHTAVAVAERFFDAPSAVGLARSGDFPDALTGGAHIGALTATAGDSGPMLLTPTTRLAASVADYLCATASVGEAAIYGGSAAIGDRIADAAATAVDGSGCSGGDPADASLTNTSVLHPRGVGLAQVGLTLRDVEHTTGASYQVSEFDDFHGRRCYNAHPDGVEAYDLLVTSPEEEPDDDPHNGIVWRATTRLSHGFVAETDAGIGPGDTRADVEAAYGADNLSESEHAFQPDGVYLDYHVEDGKFGLRFEIGSDDVVQVIHGGDGHIITWPDGSCLFE